MEDLKKALKEKNLVFGTEKTLKKLRNGDIKKIFLASNCPKKVKEDIKYYTELSKVEVVELKIPNDEIGIICKKQFPITVLCY